MFVDPRTWGTLLYMLLMLPLGVAYFTVAVTLLSTSVALIATPVLVALGETGWISFGTFEVSGVEAWQLPVVMLAGVLLLFVTLHVARAIGQLHGQLAKNLLVKSASRHAV
jgi:hypothetical protein